MVYNGEYRKKEREHELSFLNEAYFGRTANIEKMIKQIHVIREKAGVVYGSINYQKYNVAMNTWPEVIEFNRLVEEEFGFKTAGLTFMQDARLNAHTLSLSIAMDSYMSKNPKSMVQSTKTGFRYRKDAEYALAMYITTGLFLDNNFSDEEIMAVLLHEIGHNFSTAMSGELGGLVLIKSMINFIYILRDVIFRQRFERIPEIISGENWFKNLDNTLDKHTRRFTIFKITKVLADVINMVINFVNTSYSDLIFILSGLNPGVSISLALLQTTAYPAKLLNMLLGGTEDEKFADAFPAMYGLGAEQASALAKMHTGSKGFPIHDMIFNTPGIGHMANLIQFPVIFMATLIDEHPNLNQRFRMEIEYMENELKNTNMDPKLKSEIKRQLVQLKKDFKEYCDIETLKENEDPHILQRQYEDWLYRKVNGGIKDKYWKNSDIFAKIDRTRKRSDIDNSKNK